MGTQVEETGRNSTIRTVDSQYARMQCTMDMRGMRQCRCRSIWKKTRICSRIPGHKDSPINKRRETQASICISIPTRPTSRRNNHTQCQSPFRVLVVLDRQERINTTRIQDTRCIQQHLMEVLSDQQETGTAHCNSQAHLALQGRRGRPSRRSHGDATTDSIQTFAINPPIMAQTNRVAESEDKTRRTDSRDQ